LTDPNLLKCNWLITNKQLWLQELKVEL
jgi:hypothetical protein